jgi:hypothetical protein
MGVAEEEGVGEAVPEGPLFGAAGGGGSERVVPPSDAGCDRPPPMRRRVAMPRAG